MNASSPALFALLPLLACARPAAPPPQAAAGAGAAPEEPATPEQPAPLPGPRAYAFELGARVQTSAWDRASTPLELPGLEERELSWRGGVRLEPDHRYRDGSLSLAVLLDRVEFRDGERERPSGLSGRAFHLRVFDDGEILALSDLAPLVGPGRHGDLLLPLWAALSPEVPAGLTPGKAVHQRINLPFLVRELRGARIALEVDWREEAPSPPPDGGEAARHLSWTGPLAGRGDDRSGAWDAQLAFQGTASGELWLGEDGELLAHRFHWDTTVSSTFLESVVRGEGFLPVPHQGEGLPAAQLDQHWQVDGLLRAREAP